MMLLTVIIGMALSSKGGCVMPPYTISPLNNTGILFEDLGTLLVYHNTWNVLTELDLGELENQTALAEHAEHLVFRLCKNHTVASELCSSQQVHLHSIIENIKRRTATIRELIPHSRRTRSIFDGMGQAMHYLFGTMDHDNEVEVYSRLEDLEKNQQALIELEKQQISVVKNEFDKIHKPLSSLADRQRRIAYQVNDLGNLTEDLSQRQLRQEIVSNLLLQVVEIEFRQQALLDIIVASRNNQIHPLLVSPNTLLKVYTKAQVTCTVPQKCLSALYQTSEIRSHLLQEKLVIRINLPILNMPSFKFQQVQSFPIHTEANYSLVPDIEFSHVASNFQTQEFLLLSPENVRQYRRIAYGLEEHTYIGRLNVPVVKATTSTDCIVKLLFNPLNETLHCPLRLQYPQRDLLIKLTRPNTWLYSLITPQVVHVTCITQFTTAQLTGQGTLTINQPCQLQLGPKFLYFDEEDRQPLKITQPGYFPGHIDPSLISTWEELREETKIARAKPLELLSGEGTNELLRKDTQTLDELRSKLLKIEQHQSSRHARTLSTTSISVTGILAILVTIFVISKFVYPPVAHRITSLVTKTPEEEPNTEPEATPAEQNAPEPIALKRTRSMPRTRSIQLV